MSNLFKQHHLGGGRGKKLGHLNPRNPHYQKEEAYDVDEPTARVMDQYPLQPPQPEKTYSDGMIDISKFYIIAVCSNPIRFQRRWTLFKEFELHMADVGGNLLIVEQAFGRREFQLTERDHPMHLQVRTEDELWHKENMVNIGIQYLCQIDPDWEYVAWIDGDVHFHRRDIITETAHQLQHYDFVQMFSNAIDLGPNNETLQIHKGFMHQYHQNFNYPPQGSGRGGYYADGKHDFWHPGYAWAARRSAIEACPLLDRAILGAGDHHMALALIGEAHRSMPAKLSKGYRNYIMNWQDMAVHALRKNVGYVPGTITHHWHGKKKDRKYVERWDVLINNGYDPYVDVMEDAQGLLRLNRHHGDRYIRLRDDIRRYFRGRNEDSIDLV